MTPETKTRKEAKFIYDLSKQTGLSGGLLYYALHFGIMGIVQKKRRSKTKNNDTRERNTSL